MRRSFIVLLLLGIVAAISWWLFKWDSGRQHTGDPWKLLPVNTALVLEVPQPLSSWERFTSTSQLWAAWDSTPGCAQLAATMTRLHELAANNARWKEAADASPLILALAPVGDGFSTLIIWPLSVERTTAAALSPVIGADLSAASPIWNGEKVPLLSDAGGTGLSASFHDGSLLISDDGALLDDLTHRSGAVPMDSSMTRARASLGAGSDAHLLIDLVKAQRLLNVWLRPDALRDLEGLSGWAALDMRMRPEAALVSGLLFTRGEQPLLRACVPQSVARPGIARVLPANTREIHQIQVTDPLRLSTDVRGIAPPDTLFQAYGAWANGTIGFATAGLSGDSSLMRWVVVQAEDPSTALEALAHRCATSSDTIGYRSITMARSTDMGALAAVWGSWVDAVEHPWWCALGDKVVFSDDQRAMRAAIDAWTDGTSLAQDPHASAFMQRYASEAAITWWADVPKSLDAMRGSMKDAGLHELDTHGAGWRSFGNAIVQLTPERDDMFQLTACINGSGSAGAVGSDGLAPIDGALWSITLGRPLARGPWLVTDHLSRTKQILVQDDQHTIALVSCTGKVLWKRTLDGPVLGDVQQVDRFKNGKLQMLFNTAARLYLIDRNGKDVAPFPISLPEQASAPLSVFDYEGRKEYRVLVPSVEARLLNYGLDGRPVDGWSPPRTPATCKVPVQHLRLRGKDYLVLVDNSGRVSVLDRRGEKRYDATAHVAGAARMIGLRPALDIGTCAVLWADSVGNGLATTFEGSIDTLSLAPAAPSKAPADELGTADVDHDGHPEVVLWKNGERGLVQGAIPFPTELVIGSNDALARACDINLDGTIEQVMVFRNGRVAAEHTTP